MLRKTLMIAVGAMTLASTVRAQGNPQTNKVTTTVNDVLRLTIAATTPVTLPANAFDAQDTYVGTASTALDIVANRPWTLNVKAATAAFADSLGAPSSKNASDLEVAVVHASGQSFTSANAGVPQAVATGTGLDVASSTNRGRAGGTVNYRLNFSIADAPNQYSLDVVYTLTGN